jgi:hypothetical protein
MEKIALLVGVNDCKCPQPGTNMHQESLQFAENDPQLLRERLSHLGFHVPDHALLTGENATVSRVREAIRNLCQNSPALFLFFFAGHGGTDDHGFQTLCFRQADASGHWRIDDIRREVLSYKVRQFLIIVDACRRPAGGGWNARGFEPGFRRTGKLFESSDYKIPVEYGTQSAAFFGSREGQFCWEDPKHKNGVFTWALAQVLENWPPEDDPSLQQLQRRVSILMSHELDQEREQVPLLIPARSSISLTQLAGFSSIAPPELQLNEPIRYLAAGHNNNDYLLLTGKGRLFCSSDGEPWIELEAGGPVIAAAMSPLNSIIFCLVQSGSDFLLRQMGRAGVVFRTMKMESACSGLSFDGGNTLAVYGQSLIYFESGELDHRQTVSCVSNIRSGSFFRGNLLALTRDAVLECNLEQNTHRVLVNDSSMPPQHVAASSPDNWLPASWAAWSNWNKVFIYSGDSFEAGMLVPAPVTSLSFTPDERFLAAGTAAGKIYLRRRSRPDQDLQIMQTEGIVSALCFTGDGSHLLVGTSRGRLQVSSISLGTRRQAAGVTP